jgi:hypothetical protein
MRGVPFDSAQGTPLEIIESMWDSTYFDSAQHKPLTHSFSEIFDRLSDRAPAPIPLLSSQYQLQ